MPKCNKATEQCAGCHHATEHNWAVNCLCVPCTHFSNKVCATCEDLANCGKMKIMVPAKQKDADGVTMDVMVEKWVSNPRDPRRTSPVPHASCMKCKKFADASISGVKCE